MKFVFTLLLVSFLYNSYSQETEVKNYIGETSYIEILGEKQEGKHTHQTPIGKYWIYFTDKDASVFSIHRPAEFLSQRSIDRRLKHNIGLSEQDIPVNENYVQQIEYAGGEIIVKSRWLNAVSAEIFSENQLSIISQLPFVKEITPVRKYIANIEEPIPVNSNMLRTSGDAVSFYGASANQFTMINGDFLHNLGYRGKDMVIAVIDAGFIGVDNGAGYQSLWQKEQVLDVHNFPDNNKSVYISSYHGTWVLGIMAADIPGTYVGSAPDAQYYLFRSEVSDSERVAEEDFWLAAAEQADFVGADIINSSLGYTEFDDSTENHTYADMDGNTTIVTKAADWAASKGILVCNSAGNEGDSEWNFIGAPADGDSVFSIGAVDNLANYASFSSNGPTFDGRVKPNIAVQGSNFPIVNPDGTVGFGGGTSFASPLAAGAAACLWQAFPEKTNMEIMDAMQKSASQFTNPDTLLGYGIPDMALAYMNLLGAPTESEVDLLNAFTLNDEIYIIIYSSIPDNTTFYLYDVSGKKILEQELQQSDISYNALRIEAATSLAPGVYILTVDLNGKFENKKIFIR
ncbi:MAG: S8 family peptidase [Chitinophagales bacterium]